MGPRFVFRFRYWIAGGAIALVLLVTMVFIASVVGKFQFLAQDNARAGFGLVAAKGAEALEQLVQEHARALQTVAAGPQEKFLEGQRLDARDLVPELQTLLAQYPSVYSAYLGLGNDEFLQVIAVRDQLQVREAINAPSDTVYAVRDITVRDEGLREERWRFLNATGTVLQQRVAQASYAPTTRPWFQGVQASAQLFLAEPYKFASTGRIGLTLAVPVAGLGQTSGVMGLDLDLETLGDYLRRQQLSDHGMLVLLDQRSRVLAYHGMGDVYGAAPPAVLSTLEEGASAVLKDLARVLAQGPATSADLELDTAAGTHLVRQHVLTEGVAAGYRLVMAAPVSDFTGPVDQARNQVLLIAAGLLLLLVPLALRGTRSVTQAFVSLAADSEHLKRLDFDHALGRVDSYLYEVNALSDAQHAMAESIRQRTEALALARDKLARLVEGGIRLGREQDRQRLLRGALFSGRDIANCVAGTMFLRTERNTLSFAQRTNDDALPSIELPLFDAQGQPIHHFVATHVALSGETVVIDDVYSENRFDMSGTKAFSEQSGLRTVSMLTVPMMPRENEVIGVLQFINAQDLKTGEVVPFDPELVGFLEALAAQAAVALENQNLLDAQRKLVDSMIKIIAGAIDAKSPYTGGHCERVPELAIMLAEEAAKVQDGPLAGFGFASEDERREFRIGAWLHDCGKVTTPEYVVDKATKLETIYNRIHEVRMRFEVLLRDAQIDCLRAIHESGVPREQAQTALAARRAELIDDFAFIAETNMGGEFMAPERIERVQRIATQTWTRHFDDRLGLSFEEAKRYVGEPAQTLPVVEPLLADKAHHIVPRTDTRALDPKYGFKVKVPQHLYNYGEVYNLSISRGTLSEEERFKINEHIIQTIVMLEELPFPKNLMRVPEYAGTHHETMIGTGYPRRLEAKDLSIPSRIMAIADIFEALTASDRPYKKAKTLSESVKILSFFKKDKHIDPVLFDLFLTTGLYRRYAERYLLPEQIDEVDVAAYVSPAEVPA